MKKFIVLLFATILVFGMSSIASAITITDLYGDKDGFGIGILPDQSFDQASVVSEPDDDGFTDEWVRGNQSWTHIYDISGLVAITSASLEVFTGGQGWYGTSKLYVDDQYIGDLTDGDISGGPSEGSIARLDTFDLMIWESYLNGSDTIRIDTIRNGDGWVLDYSEIIIEGTASGPVVIPEPATMLLLGTGLIGIAGFSRKKFKK